MDCVIRPVPSYVWVEPNSKPGEGWWLVRCVLIEKEGGGCRLTEMRIHANLRHKSKTTQVISTPPSPLKVSAR